MRMNFLKLMKKIFLLLKLVKDSILFLELENWLTLQFVTSKGFTNQLEA